MPDAELVFHLTNRLASFDSRNVTPETRQKFLEQLRALRQSEGDQIRYGLAIEHMALELGDTDYIEQLYVEWLSDSIYMKRSGLRPFENARNPEFVGRFIKHLDRKIPKPDGSVEQDLQKSIAYTIQNQLKRCPHFNATTREWANSLTLSDIRPLLHDFWEHNKERFEAKDYGAIYPPGMEPPPKRARDVPAIAMQLKDRSVAKGNHGGNADPATTRLESAPTGSDETAPAREKPRAITEDSSPILLLLLLVLVTGGAIWFFLRRP